MARPKPAAASKTGSAKAASGKRKRRTTEELLERIVSAATEEFKTYGFAGATVADIARRAEVTEAQVFRYFDSKTDLFRAAVFDPLNKHFLGFLPGHLTDAKHADSIPDKARQYVTELQHFLSEHANLWMSLLVAEKYGRDIGLAPSQIDGLQTYFERGAATMKSNRRRQQKVPPELMVRVSFAGVLGCILFKDWVFPDGMASEAEIRAAINEFVMDGVNANAAWAGTAPAPRKRKTET